MNSALNAVSGQPEYLRLDALLKATPHEEGGKRFIYLEASNEDVDYQNQRTLQKALGDSAAYFLRHGNIDLSHYTLLGPATGMPNFLDYEVGRPVAAQVDGSRTFVKAELYRGESPQGRNGQMVWDSMTKQVPPCRWYPSVGGQILAKAMQFDPATKQNVEAITRVLWSNVALDRTPVNKTVGTASAVPIGVFAKSMPGALLLRKSDAAGPLTMGYSTDSAAMSGGQALSRQSLDGKVKSYYAFRDALAKAIRRGEPASNNSAGLIEYAVQSMGVDEGQAAGLVRRFLQDLRSLSKGTSA